MSTTTHFPEPPKPLQSDTVTARLIRERLWRPANLEDDWRVFVVVGREGTGKSLTCASILNAVDPTFNVERTHFDPIPFLQDIGEERDRPGVAVMGDESGVAFGNRTWHDREQVEANQALQTARDYNRVVGMTLPRLEELDVQLQGRIHVLLETVSKRDGEWVEVKWKNVQPSRTGQGKEYKKYPKMRVNGSVRKIERIRIGPPPSDYINAYQEKKREWKQRLFGRVIDRYRDEESETTPDLSPKQIANDIIEKDAIEEYIGDNNGQRYVDADMIALDYEIGDRKSKKVKKAIKREVGENVM